MAAKLCNTCNVNNGINHMIGKVTQALNLVDQIPLVTEWTCPYCGNIDIVEEMFEPAVPSSNSGIVQGPGFTEE